MIRVKEKQTRRGKDLGSRDEDEEEEKREGCR